MATVTGWTATKIQNELAAKADLSTLAETIRDTIASALIAGSNITVNVDDVNNTITIASTGGGATDPEVVRDTIGSTLVAGTNVSIDVSDANNTITISATGGAGGLTAEQTMDTIANMITAGAGVNVTYNDGSDTLTISIKDAQSLTVLTDATTININSDTTSRASVTLGGNRTLANPTGSPIDGQRLLLRVVQDAVGNRVLGFASAYRFGTDVPSVVLSTGGNKVDYIGFQFNQLANKWDCVAFVKGY